jgi:hypothetical protein
LTWRQARGRRGLLWSFWARERGRRCGGNRAVFEEFLDAGAGDVGQFDLGFFGAATGLAGFENVLFAGARGLHHLVASARAQVNEAAAEA